MGANYINFKPVAAWAMNDRLCKRKLCSQIRSMKKYGYGGMLIIPWGGLRHNFMSDKWMDMVGYILDMAHANNLEVWLWDDWIFPSGFGGGLVCQNEKYRAKKLRVAIDIVIEDREQARILIPPRAITMATCSIDKFNNFSDRFKILSLPKEGQCLTYTARGRQRIILVVWEFCSAMQHTIKSKYDDDPRAFSVDMLNSEATAKFLNLIHERYWHRFKSHFGKTLKGFFYDEPGITLFTLFPWTYGFEDEFKKRKGYDIRLYIGQILLGLKSENIERALADYMDVWTDLTAENFYGVIQRWCSNHGILSIGHQGADNATEDIVSRSGMLFKNMRYTDIPGIDVIWDQIKPGKFTDFPRFAGSSKRLLCREYAMSESFGAMGQGMDLNSMRYVAEHQIIRGVNKFFVKLFNYNPKKAFYYHPPELSGYNPIIRHYGNIFYKRIENLCRVMSKGISLEASCIYVPMYNIYKREIGIAKDVDLLAQKLTYNQIEFVYVWADNLNKLKDDRCNCLLLNKYKYVIIIPGTDIEGMVIQKIKLFVKHGIEFLTYNNYAAGLPIQNFDSMDEMVNYIRKNGGNLFKIEPPGLPISISTRILENHCIILLLNESEKHQHISMEFLKPGPLYEMDCNTSELVILNGSTKIPSTTLEFMPGESKLLILGVPQEYPVKPKSRQIRSGLIKIDSLNLTLPDGSANRLKFPFPSWQDLGYETYTGFMRYRIRFKWDRKESMANLNLGKVCYAATLYLDGKLVGKSVFVPHIIQLQDIKKGSHVLEINVLNTSANLVCGSEERYQTLLKKGVFDKTYASFYVNYDKERLVSGLFGPITICPVTLG